MFLFVHEQVAVEFQEQERQHPWRRGEHRTPRKPSLEELEARREPGPPAHYNQRRRKERAS